jgi:hypothetical protein
VQAGIELKESADDDGHYTADQLFAILTDIYSYVISVGSDYQAHHIS